MRVTIVRESNTVIVDGVSRTVDCSALSDRVHVVQWDGIAGEVEFVPYRIEGDTRPHKEPNGHFGSLEPFQKFVDAWSAANAPG